MLKKLMRRMGGPFWRRIRPVIYKRIDWRIWAFYQQTDKSWTVLAPTFLNAISTVQTFGRELSAMKQQQREDLARLQQEIQTLRAQLDAYKERTEPVPADVAISRPAASPAASQVVSQATVE